MNNSIQTCDDCLVEYRQQSACSALKERRRRATLNQNPFTLNNDRCLRAWMGATLHRELKSN